MYLRACRRTTTSVRAVRQRPTSSASISSNKSPAIAWVQRVLMSGDLNKERSDRAGPMAAVNLDRFWEVGIVSSPNTGEAPSPHEQAHGEGTAGQIQQQCFLPRR